MIPGLILWLSGLALIIGLDVGSDPTYVVFYAAGAVTFVIGGIIEEAFNSKKGRRR